MENETRVHIDSMAFKGYGVARIKGKVVFIPYSLTGEEGGVEIIEEKKRYSIGRMKKILISSPWRVNPSCPYFGVCGGCQWQHIDSSVQGEFKREILKEVLKRLGGLKEIPPIHVASPLHPYGYRARVQLKATGNAIGYYQERSHQIVDIDHCPIAHPLVNQVIQGLRKEYPAFSQMGTIELNISPEEGKGILILSPLSFGKGMEHGLRKFLQAHPILKGAAIKRKPGFILFDDVYLYSTLSVNRNGGENNLRVRTSPQSFSQINPEQNQTLVQIVLQYSEVKREERVLDLYAGIGNFTLPLAIKAKEVIAIEENRSAVEDAQFNIEKNGIKNCTMIQGKVEEILKPWSREKFNLVVLDPPRKGCKMVVDQVARLKPERMVYVSCEPTTLSRDLHFFSENGYQLQKLCLIDMFPQTYHMEVVALLNLNVS